MEYKRKISGTSVGKTSAVKVITLSVFRNICVLLLQNISLFVWPESKKNINIIDHDETRRSPIYKSKWQSFEHHIC